MATIPGYQTYQRTKKEIGWVIETLEGRISFNLARIREYREQIRDEEKEIKRLKVERDKAIF